MILHVSSLTDSLRSICAGNESAGTRPITFALLNSVGVTSAVCVSLWGHSAFILSVQIGGPRDAKATSVRNTLTHFFMESFFFLRESRRRSVRRLVFNPYTHVHPDWTFTFPSLSESRPRQNRDFEYVSAMFFIDNRHLLCLEKDAINR